MPIKTQSRVCLPLIFMPDMYDQPNMGCELVKTEILRRRSVHFSTFLSIHRT